MIGKIFRFLFGKGSSVRHSGIRIVIDKNMVAKKWEEIEEMVNLGGPSRFKSAIMDADKLLDYALKGNGFKGETMGDRLKSAQGKLDRATLDAAWRGHKYRNRIAHEINTEVMNFEVKREIENFKKVLIKLGVL